MSVHSENPVDLGKNHQVLAWAYEDEAELTVVRVYDPNKPDRDDVTIAFRAPTRRMPPSSAIPAARRSSVSSRWLPPRGPSPLFEDGR